LLIQQNNGRSNFFNRSWAEFKVGFNDSDGNYWLGNDQLSQLTATGRYKLRFDLQSRCNGSWYYAEYSTFRVLTEADNYRLQVSGYSGNAGYDSFGEHNGTMFTTYDRDNNWWSGHNVHPSGNCALANHGGFWYRHCALCVVNSAHGSSFVWYGVPDRYLQSSRMWLLCK